MDLRKTLLLASETLTAASVEHALIGGMALAMHGINRATADVDFLAPGAKREVMLEALTRAGFVLKFSSAEVLQFGGVGQLDILLAKRPLSLKMITNATVSNRLPIKVLRVEDIIGLKIQAYQNDRTREYQDKADIQSLIAAKSEVDWSLIKEYADLFGEWQAIETLKAAR